MPCVLRCIRGFNLSNSRLPSLGAFGNTRRVSSDVSLPHRTDVVICGGGLSGLSLLYHLLKLGVKNVVLLEKLRVGHGSTKLCKGTVGNDHLWEHVQVQRLAKKSKHFVNELAEKYPEIRYEKCGRLYLAKTDQTTLDLRRMRSLGLAKKLRASFRDVASVGREFNIPTERVKSALFFEDSNGVLNSAALVDAILEEIRILGGRFVEGCAVHAMKVDKNNTVTGALTDFGFVECEAFVNAAGVWASDVRVLSPDDDIPMSIPVGPVSHAYLKVNHLNNPVTTIIHDLDCGVLVAPNHPTTGMPTSIVAGGFKQDACKALRYVPDGFGDSRKERWDAFYPILQALCDSFPFIMDAQIESLDCGAVCVTGDGVPLVGETPQYHNCYILGGWGGHGLSLAFGAAERLANWIFKQDPLVDISAIDAARFHSVHYNQRFLADRGPEIMALAYKMQGHQHACRTARDIRTSPLHASLKAEGAVFGEIMGYERPLFFVSKSSGAEQDYVHWMELASQTTKPPFFERTAAEYEACRHRVGVIDMSNFSKFDVTGDEEAVVDYLQYLCSADIDVEVGRTVFSGMQNDQGGYFTDCTLSRLAKDRYFMIAPTVQQVRVKWWMDRHRDRIGDGHVDVQDVTSMYTALNVIGPSSRSLMEDITEENMDAHNFPAFSCKEIDIGYASDVRAISVTHTGELGWVLYIPNEFAKHVYNEIVSTGKEYGLKHVGYFTLRNLRMEKFYVYWGFDIDYSTTPFECGREFRVNFDKANFKGRDALMRQRQEGVKRRYVQMIVEGHDNNVDPWPRGNEPVYRNGEFCGFTTSVGYGFTLDAHICLGYLFRLDTEGRRMTLDADWLNDRKGHFEIEVAGKRFPVQVGLHSPHLPMISSEHPVHFRPTQ